MLVFHPNGPTCGVYEVISGTHVKELKGHYANITVTLFHPYLEEMYTGDSTGQILVYTPRLGEELQEVHFLKLLK